MDDAVLAQLLLSADGTVRVAAESKDGRGQKRGMTRFCRSSQRLIPAQKRTSGAESRQQKLQQSGVSWSKYERCSALSSAGVNTGL
jgi:hypothetical protein